MAGLRRALAAALCLMTFHRALGQPTEVWLQRYGNQVGGFDSATELATDSAGNATVAGITTGSSGQLDFLIMKYSEAGLPIWTNHYSSSNGDSVATSMAVDKNGNVLVTGISAGVGNSDSVAIKYSGSGEALWTNRYAGSASSYVSADNAGNVFVTGSSASDYVTIKYSSTGIPLWTNRYNGPGDNSDFVSGIVVDSTGNAVVTGASFGNDGTEYATIKYSSTGAALWTNRYGLLLNSVASALALDSADNVLVTGRSYNGSDDDYATIKYSSAGESHWTNRYTASGYSEDNAFALAVDVNGDVIVTGSSGNGFNASDFATIKYSSAGVPLWTNRYDGPGNDFDSANAVAVDSDGNAFVTGTTRVDLGGNYDYATIKYSVGGVPLWTNRYNGPANYQDSAIAVAVDGGGNVLVTGSVTVDIIDGTDGVTIKYSGAGIPLWTNRYGGLTSSGDEAKGIAVSGNGNVVVTGLSGGLDTATDYATVAYSNTGVPLWTNRYNGPLNWYDEAVNVVVDLNGNAVVTGSSTGNGSYRDYATIKYSVAGVGLWTNRYNGLGNGEDYAHAVAVDSNGNVVVTGDSLGVANSDYATIKYSAAGVALWTNRYSGPGDGYDAAAAVAVDASGSMIVTGYSYADNAWDDYTTIKYSAAGATMWTKRYNGPANDTDLANAVAVDGGGNVFVTGGSLGTSFDYATIKYSDAGTELWVRRYDGLANGDDEATALAVDGNGNVIVTGFSESAGAYNYTTIKYSSSGVALWTNYFGPGDNSKAAIAVDGSDNVFVTGRSMMVAYSGAGVPLWTNVYPVGLGSVAAADGSGNVFLTGGNSDYVTRKYSVAALQPTLLNYQLLGNQIVLSWANAAFGLQSAPAVLGMFTNIPGATSPFTNPISGGQRYFQLKAN